MMTQPSFIVHAIALDMAFAVLLSLLWFRDWCSGVGGNDQVVTSMAYLNGGVPPDAEVSR